MLSAALLLAYKKVCGLTGPWLLMWRVLSSSEKGPPSRWAILQILFQAQTQDGDFNVKERGVGRGWVGGTLIFMGGGPRQKPVTPNLSQMCVLKGI